ncbi:hypothetical protein IMG5_063830 [Ichthyophthirius multifiliis]|uniref:Centrosomal protein POC5 n=1 Tax=Ichthyophthirius multifiliis TaxID=5932 RepID=G0QP46_ICHMU|nr:hypothetical protein IMG5_063830 [Ichthyophthirius multifiliis]EGR33012.1 hypothetical protein IMG5_063830 [Ichthyophthirius multifiliis]|eukprot:XP_004036998.1 hypothetical protein IMG5_063830 [Ichthyophthirius multifiliis]
MEQYNNRKEIEKITSDNSNSDNQESESTKTKNNPTISQVQSHIIEDMQSQKQKKKQQNPLPYFQRNHNPQIVDEDTEHFKIKVEHLLSVFKADAISEFMGMKRSLLEDQKQQIKQQTERYLLMYEDKNKEVYILLKKLKQTQFIYIYIKQKNQSLLYIQKKQKSSIYIYIYLYIIFLYIYLFFIQTKKNQKKQQLAQKYANKNLKIRIFSNFSYYCQQNSSQNKLTQQQNKHLSEVEEITLKFQKEISLLKQQFQESQKALQQINENKENMQENLKKAFMRGICALNFEAMNVIGNPVDPLQEQIIQKTEQLVQKTEQVVQKTEQIAYQHEKTFDNEQNLQNQQNQFNSLLINPVQDNDKSIDKISQIEFFKNEQKLKSIVFYQKKIKAIRNKQNDKSLKQFQKSYNF